MIDVTGIDHIYLSVSDLPRAEAFYDRVLQNVLGFRKNTFTLASDPHIQYYNRHFGYVLRPARDRVAHASHAPGLHHLCLRVDSITDVTEAARQLAALDIGASAAKHYPEYAPDYWATHLTDPDGIRLEITNYREERRVRHDHWLAAGTTDGATRDGATRPTLEFWFEFASPYSYLSAMRIEALAQRHDIKIDWKPFLLGPIFRAMGWETSPMLDLPQKAAHMWRDVARQAAAHGLPFARPAVFPRAAVLPARVAVAHAEQPWIGAFCRAVMQQNFVADVDINDPAQVRRALHGLVADPAAVIAVATDADHASQLREQTAAAGARGIFGAPTFFIGDEMFWGDDRLEAALQHAIAAHARPEEHHDAR